jgi:adenosylhomocysteine nucleosidase
LTLNIVGVVCALAAEARHLGPAPPRAQPLTSLGDGTLLAVSGMGRAAAAQSARALIGAGATALVSWGMAGGLDPALSAGTIFLPSEVISLDGAAVVTARQWRERLGAAIAACRPATRDSLTHGLLTQGRLLTSPKAVGSLADKATLFNGMRAMAVDMESFAVAEVALANQLPFIAVRVIVDSAADVLPRAVTAAADGEGHLQMWRLMGALARAPADLAPLIRLARRYRAANRSLAAVARVGSLAPYAFSGAPDNLS